MPSVSPKKKRIWEITSFERSGKTNNKTAIAIMMKNGTRVIIQSILPLLDFIMLFYLMNSSFKMSRFLKIEKIIQK